MPRLNRLETVLSGRFHFRNPALLCARVRLYSDRLELSGWHLRGRYFRKIPLHHILHADAPDTDTLLLWLSDGETIRLQMKETLQWRRAIEQQLTRDRNQSI